MSRNSLYNEKNRSRHMQPEVKAYYFKDWNGFKMPYHEHDRIEIMYVLKGRCKVEFHEKMVNMKNGTYIMIDAGVPHRLLVEDDEVCRMLNLEFIFMEKQSQGMPSVKELIENDEVLLTLFEHDQPYIVLKDVDEVYPALKRLVLELDKTRMQRGLLQHLLLSQILIDISVRLKETLLAGSRGSVAHVKKAINYMNINYDSDIRMHDIAAAVNVHPGYLHRIFKQNTGMTVMEHLTKLRIERAKMFLGNTTESIIDIAGHVGMNSRQYFSFLFKKHTGMTPFEYRKDSLDDAAKKS